MDKPSYFSDEEWDARKPRLLIWYGDKPPEPPAYLVQNTLPETGVGIIGGQWGLGKTYVGADASAAVMTKGEFAGEPVVRKGAVLWFAAEGESEIEERVRAAIENKFGGSGLQPFARQAGGVPLLTESDVLEKLKAYAEEAAKRARDTFDLPLALIVIDTLSAAAGFDDENSASETQKVMSMLHELSRATGAFVLVIDHYGKMTETGVRGSSAKSASADVILACLGERDSEGNVSNQRLAIAKLRSGPSGRVIRFDLRETETACVVEWRVGAVEPELKAPPERWPKSLAVFRRSLENALTDFPVKAYPFIDGREELTVYREHVRGEFMRAYPADNRKAKGEAFRRCEKEAVSRGVIGARSPGDDLSKTFFWIIHDGL